MGLIEKAEGLVGLTALAAIGYIVIKNWQNIKDIWCSIPGVCDTGGVELQCPSGFHKEEQYPGMCIKDADPVNYDEHGCRTDIQKYCDIQNRCLDKVIYENACKPEPVLTDCPVGTHRNVNLPGYPCHPDTVVPPSDPAPMPIEGGHWCADGSYRGPNALCPEDQDPCGPEIPEGSGCHPRATGGIEAAHCQVNCNTRCSDIYGNYKDCDNLDPFWNTPNPYACASGVPVDSTGYYPDTFGNLMKNCIEVCHRGDSNCAHNLPVEAGDWRFVYD